jgi:hypothetical protein
MGIPELFGKLWRAYQGRAGEARRAHERIAL